MPQKIESYDLNKWLNSHVADITILVVVVDTKCSLLYYDYEKLKWVILLIWAFFNKFCLILKFIFIKKYIV